MSKFCFSKFLIPNSEFENWDRYLVIVLKFRFSIFQNSRIFKYQNSVFSKFTVPNYEFKFEID